MEVKVFNRGESFCGGGGVEGLLIGEPFLPPDVASGSTVEVGGTELELVGLMGKVFEFVAL